MGSEFAQCRSFSLSSQGCLWPPRCPSKCSLENLNSHTPLQRKHSPHTHAYRRMCHEGPPAVAVTDMGNTQNTSIFKIWHAHSLSYTYTPKINMVGLFTHFTPHDFIQDAFPSAVGVKLIITMKSHQIPPTSQKQSFINRTRAYEKLNRSSYISFQSFFLPIYRTPPS